MLKKRQDCINSMASWYEIIVPDIADQIRKQRIRKRLESGNADNFDRYLAKDGAHSERIENFLIRLGKTYLNAAIIENCDLDDAALFRALAPCFHLLAPV